MKISLNPSDVLIVVDMQNDFLPGGSLAVPDGDQIIPFINLLLARFSVRVLTRDWHPANHISFSSQPAFTDGSWPPHCVQNTPGAEFHPSLRKDLADKIVSKGDLADREAYSGFQETDLQDWLTLRGLKRVFVCGVATDYCVKATVLDSLQAGFSTFLILDAIRAVNTPRGSTQAVAAMRAMGAEIVTARELLA